MNTHALRAAVEKANTRGHDMEHDPPAALTSMDRYTCKICGKAALGNARIAYGGATEYACQKPD